MTSAPAFLKITAFWTQSMSLKTEAQISSIREPSPDFPDIQRIGDRDRLDSVLLVYSLQVVHRRFQDLRGIPVAAFADGIEKQIHPDAFPVYPVDDIRESREIHLRRDPARTGIFLRAGQIDFPYAISFVLFEAEYLGERFRIVVVGDRKLQITHAILPISDSGFQDQGTNSGT